MLSKVGPAYTEIGQILLTNGITHSHEADWATNGLDTIAEIIAERRGYKSGKHELCPLLTTDDNEEEFDNDVFSMRTYCWCDGARIGHEESCPPNFMHKRTGIEMSWYQHSGRGITANVDWLPALTWHRIINECIESVVAIELS
jgi:hypothetical protein